jgi:hypothetical protein
VKLRTGTEGRTLYIQLGDEPSADDELLGLCIDPARAAVLVEIANGDRPPFEHLTGETP